LNAILSPLQHKLSFSHTHSPLSEPTTRVNPRPINWTPSNVFLASETFLLVRPHVLPCWLAIRPSPRPYVRTVCLFVCGSPSCWCGRHVGGEAQGKAKNLCLQPVCGSAAPFLSPAAQTECDPVVRLYFFEIRC
jgi:hypothetical protein